MKKKIIIITPEHEVADEPRIITSLLDAGADFVHLRHPGASASDIRRIIGAIPQCFHSRLRLHDHFALAGEFTLGGLHLNGRSPEPPSGYSGSLSLTCHSVAEVRSASVSGRFDYVTLSPIFASISKPGYGGSVFTDEELGSLTADDKVVALGGITPERIGLLDRYHFIGYAMLGHVWHSVSPSQTIKDLLLL